MKRLTDTLKMLDLLSSRNICSISELSDYLGVTARTVQRIRDDLEYLGYRINTIYGPGGGYKLMNSSQIHPLAFTSQEIGHIRQGLRTLLALQDTSYGGDFVAALAKLNHQFDAGTEQVSVSAFRSVRLNVDGAVYHSHIRLIEDAISSQKRIKIIYNKSPRIQKEYILEPYELILVDQIWYVNGYLKGSHQINFRIPRITNIVMLDEEYLVDTNYSSRHSMTQYGFKINPVRLKVLISNRDYFSEYIWGDDQEIEWVNDVQYTLSVTFPNEYVAKSFILEGGSSLVVQEPESLKTWIMEEVSKIKQMYE